jgi:exodeoxyribonuclease V gamma subunit
VLAGHGIDRATGAEWRRGTLPPQRLGKRALDVLTDEVRAIRDACGEVAAEEGASIDLVVDLGGGRLTGSVPGVRQDTVLRATFASLSAKHRLRAWVQLLALTAALPDRPWTAVTVGRGDGAPARSVLGPVDAGEAWQRLDELVALYRDGLCRPAPLPPKTAALYALRRRRSSEYAARRFAAFREWESRFGERDDAWQQLFGADVTLEELCAEPAESDRGEGTRFGELARLVWDPLFAAERTGGAR